MSLPLSLTGNNGDGFDRVEDDHCDYDDDGVDDDEDGDDIDDVRL